MSDWRPLLLQAIGAPVNTLNLNALQWWAESEGTPPEWNNWLATTRNCCGGVPASPNNVPPVRKYPTVEDGVEATRQTIMLPYYPEALVALRAGTSYRAIWEGINASPWCANCQSGKYPIVLYQHMNDPVPTEPSPEPPAEEEPVAETVRQHFNIRTACWQREGGCTTVHDTHIHVDFNPRGEGTPKCAGGSGGWSSPGSPPLQAFKAELNKRFPEAGSLGTFNCRKISGSSSWSQHAYWNAYDVGGKNYPDALPRALGDRIWAWMNGPWDGTDGGGTEEDDMTPDEVAQVFGYKTADSAEIRGRYQAGLQDGLEGRTDRSGGQPEGSTDYAKGYASGQKLKALLEA
jgi:hypothetical protein